MGALREKLHQFRFKGILVIALVYALITAILFVELSGVQILRNTRTLTLLTKDDVVTKEQACVGLNVDTLVLYSTADNTSMQAYEQFVTILTDMKVGANFVDLSFAATPALRDYRVVIPLFSDLSYVGHDLLTICNWVRNDGGCVYFPLTIEKNPFSTAIENKLGIVAEREYSHADVIYLHDGFMIGGGRAFMIPDSYDSARTVQLNPETTRIYASIDDDTGAPLIWESAYGKGKFIINNTGYADKAFRGFHAACLSLCKDVFLYPVINGSAFYLDDFPSQIPEGNSEYILRDYNTTIRDFYINIWWPDMMNLSDKYGLKFTGLAIECYDDAVDGTTDAMPDTGTFTSFGNMLLRKGGELGYHGYNHMPLCIDRDYKGIYDYKPWNDTESMVNAFAHLVDFCDSLFPDEPMSVYVPPSNLLASEGREMLEKEFPHIKTYSGIYLPDDVLDFSLLQEFSVDENGIVDQPRIISGCIIDEFMALGALSELNFHYVNNHFTHPDDALDPERGAEIGWQTLHWEFDKFLAWLYDSAPGLRNLTGTELSAAVQRFAAAAPHVRTTQQDMTVTIDNFYDNAQFLIRFNEKTPDTVKGGKLIHQTGDLYLLQATSALVTITFQ